MSLWDGNEGNGLKVCFLTNPRVGMAFLQFVVVIATPTTAYCIFCLPPLFNSSLFPEPHFVLGTYISYQLTEVVSI